MRGSDSASAGGRRFATASPYLRRLRSAAQLHAGSFGAYEGVWGDPLRVTEWNLSKTVGPVAGAYFAL
jgi:hypothetical protein